MGTYNEIEFTTDLLEHAGSGSQIQGGTTNTTYAVLTESTVLGIIALGQEGLTSKTKIADNLSLAESTALDIIDETTGDTNLTEGAFLVESMINGSVSEETKYNLTESQVAILHQAGVASVMLGKENEVINAVTPAGIDMDVLTNIVESVGEDITMITEGAIRDWFTNATQSLADKLRGHPEDISAVVKKDWQMFASNAKEKYDNAKAIAGAWADHVKEKVANSDIGSGIKSAYEASAQVVKENPKVSMAVAGTAGAIAGSLAVIKLVKSIKNFRNSSFLKKVEAKKGASTRKMAEKAINTIKSKDSGKISKTVATRFIMRLKKSL